MSPSRIYTDRNACGHHRRVGHARHWGGHFARAVAGRRDGRERVHQTQVLSRLAEQFRSDMGAAVRQIPAQGDRPKQWQFALADNRTVTYQALPGEVRRDERAADKLVRQESYALPEGYTAAIKGLPVPSESRRSEIWSSHASRRPWPPGAKCGLPPGWARIIGSPSRRGRPIA